MKETLTTTLIISAILFVGVFAFFGGFAVPSLYQLLNVALLSAAISFATSFIMLASASFMNRSPKKDHASPSSSDDEALSDDFFDANLSRKRPALTTRPMMTAMLAAQDKEKDIARPKASQRQRAM